MIFGIDILISGSSSEGKCKQSEDRPTIYKKRNNVNHSLKTKVSRNFVSEVERRFLDFAFSLNDFENPV